MSKEKALAYPLDIQLFASDPSIDLPAEPTPKPSIAPTTVSVDYNKIEEIINKRVSATEEKTFKGILKDEGLSEDEIKQAVSDYKSRKVKKASDEQEKVNAIIKENEAFRSEKKAQLIISEAKTIASELKVKTDRVDKLLKISDQSKFVKDDGTIDKAAIKAEFEVQLKDLPEFVDVGKGKITIISTKGADTPPTLTDDAQYRRNKYGKSKYFKG